MYIYTYKYICNKKTQFVDLVIENFGIQLQRNIVQESLLKDYCTRKTKK